MARQQLDAAGRSRSRASPDALSGAGQRFQAAVANFNPFGGETHVNSKNADRGPLLISAGDSDNTVPLAITEASYKIQSKNPGITEIERIKGRGHSLVIDHGWNEVADAALAFVKRFV